MVSRQASQKTDKWINALVNVHEREMQGEINARYKPTMGVPLSSCGRFSKELIFTLIKVRSEILSRTSSTCMLCLCECRKLLTVIMFKFTKATYFFVPLMSDRTVFRCFIQTLHRLSTLIVQLQWASLNFTAYCIVSPWFNQCVPVDTDRLWFGKSEVTLAQNIDSWLVT